MKKIEERKITNPREWIVEGTTIFVIPQAVVSSNDPETAKFTIRHGCFSQKNGKLMGIVSDFIENGADDFGGFHTFSDVVSYLNREATFCEKISKFVNCAMYEHAANVLIESNKNNRFYYGKGLSKKQALSKIEHTPSYIWEQRAKAWRTIYNETIDAISRGVVNECEAHLGINLN
jgi:hypothetical protein